MMCNDEIIDLLKHQIHEMGQDIENYLGTLERLELENEELKQQLLNS